MGEKFSTNNLVMRPSSPDVSLIEGKIWTKPTVLRLLSPLEVAHTGAAWRTERCALHLVELQPSLHAKFCINFIDVVPGTLLSCSLLYLHNFAEVTETASNLNSPSHLHLLSAAFSPLTFP